LKAFLVSAKGNGRGARSTFARAFGIKVKIKVNVKGNGQECPFHTGKSKSNVNVKTALRASVVPTSRKGREKWGTPV
jgi:hypothetical protein